MTLDVAISCLGAGIGMLSVVLAVMQPALSFAEDHGNCILATDIGEYNLCPPHPLVFNKTVVRHNRVSHAAPQEEHLGKFTILHLNETIRLGTRLG